MTSLNLKTPTARHLIDSIDSILGSSQLRSGRFWYKGQQNCDLVLLREGKTRTLHASGSVRFRLHLEDDGDEASGSLHLLSWLRETPNAIRIVRTLLADQAADVVRRRNMKEQMIAYSEVTGAALPEMTEAIGTHFSVKADESKLEEKDRITHAESERNFEAALKTRWYHQGFVNFCRQNGVKCYYRPAIETREPWTASVEKISEKAAALN